MAFPGLLERVKAGMKSAKSRTAAQIVSFGGASARVRQRSDGLWVVRWREAKKGRSTTAISKERAMELAKTRVRELAGKSGARMVSVIEAEAIARLKGVIGARSLSAAVDTLADGVQRLGDWAQVSRAIEAWIKAGHGKIQRTAVEAAVERFLALHEQSAGMYRGGMRKELEAYAEAFPGLCVSDITEDMLSDWINRRLQSGDEPGPRFRNNRLATWKTFLNQCRRWHMLPADGKHPGETIKKQKEPDRVPDIWTVDQAQRALDLVREQDPQMLSYLLLGCWMGLRPFEIQRLTWEAFDWTRGYLNVGAHVAQKTMQQRFVPIPENIAPMLLERSKIRTWGVQQISKARHCVRMHDARNLAQLLRQHGVIQEWTQDVMRHSYISYRLAQGHGRGEVAEWCGNSETVIRQRYRRPLRREDGDAWFAVR